MKTFSEIKGLIRKLWEALLCCMKWLFMTDRKQNLSFAHSIKHKEKKQGERSSKPLDVYLRRSKAGEAEFYGVALGVQLVYHQDWKL